MKLTIITNNLINFFTNNLNLMLMRNNFSLLTHKGRWLLATLTLLFTLGIGNVWADYTPTAAALKEYIVKDVSKPGGAGRFTSMDGSNEGIYFLRSGGCSIDGTYGLKTYDSSTPTASGVVFYLSTSTKVSVKTTYAGNKVEASYSVYIKDVTLSQFEYMETGTKNNSNYTVDLSSATVNKTKNISVVPDKNAKNQYISTTKEDVAEWTLPSGAYFVTLSETTDPVTKAKICLTSVKLESASSYTVTFDNNGHGGTAPEAQSGITSGGKATEPTEPEDASYNFGGWYNKADWQADGAEKWNFGTSTVTKDTTLYAKWTDKSVPSTDATLSALSVAGCTFNETFDPATLAYTVDLPFYASMPTASAVTATKNDENAADPVVSIAGNVISVEVTPESGAAGKKTYTITVNIADAPAASSSINIEQAVLDNSTGYNIGAALSTAHIVVDGTNGLDSLNDDPSKTARNYPYLGLKFKKKDADIIKIVVPANNVLNVKFGNVGIALTTTVNGVAGAGVAKASSGSYHLDAATVVREVVFRSSAKETVTLQQVKIGAEFDLITLPYLVTYDAGAGTCATAKAVWTGSALTLPDVTPATGFTFEGWYDAASEGNKIGDAGDTYTPTSNIKLFAIFEGIPAATDLDALTYAIGSGNPVNVGYSVGTYTYDVELPYKASYETITVSATPVSGASIKAGASMTVSSLPGAATFTVTDGLNEQAYTVNFKKAAKDGICIIKATPTSGTEATADGLYKGNAYFKGRADDKKLNTNGEHYVGVALASGYTFQSGDEVRLNQVAEVNGTTDLSKIYLYKEVPTGDNLIVTLDNTGVQGDNVFAMPSEFYGESALYIGRKDANCNPTVGYLAVYRAMNPVLKKMTVAGVDGTPNELNEIVIEVPYSTPASALASITYDWISNSDAWTAAHTPAVANEWAFGEANTVTLEDKDGDQTVYTVTINKAAASSVNTLSYLEVDGVEVDVPGNGIYTIADPLPYGTQPIITDATATHAGAVAEISNTPVHYVDANNDFWYVQVVVTPEDQDPAHRGYYQVRYTNLPKMGVTLIKGALTSNTAATITGLVGGTYDLSISTQEEDGGYKVNSANYFGLTLADGYFQNGDIIAIEVTKASTSGGSTIAVYSDNSASAEKLITNSGALGKVGMNYFVLSIPTNVENLNTLYIARNDENNPDNKWNGYVKSFEVMRAMPSVIKSFVVEGAQGEIDQVNKTIAVEVPKSSSLAALTPVVEAYANGGATVTPTGAQNFADGAVTYTVNSAYPTEDAAVEYQVTITKSISDKIVIFDGSEASPAVHASPDEGLTWTVTGMGSITSHAATVGGKNYTKALPTSGSTNSSKYIELVVPNNHQAQVYLVQYTNSNNSERNAFISTTKTKTIGEDALFVLANSVQATPSAGTSPVLSSGTYYINFDNSINFHEISVILTPTAEKPNITTQPVSKTDFGAGNLTATVVVADPTDGGELSYQWYNADGNVAVDGATGTTLTTTTEGTYYVIVTNTKAGLPSNSVKSNEAELAYRDLTIATLSALAYGDPATAITLEENKYAYNVYLPEGTTDVPALSATATQAAYGVTPVIADAAAFIDYKATSTVTVTAEDNQTQLTYTVKFHVAHSIDALVDVTENTIWDWTEITARADGSEIDVPSGDKVYGPQVVTADGLILANYVLGGNKWDRIEGNNGGYAIRSSSMQYYQGASLHFHTTKGGIVTIKARNDGSSMTLNVENAGRDMELGTLPKNSFEDFVVYVKAGDVTIYNVPANTGKPMRVQRIEFAVKESADYTRNVTNNIGTLCVDHNVLVGGAMGATFYQIASRNELYNDKIDFEEVLPNEELKAGEPYIFQSTTGRIDLFFGETDAPQPVAVRGMIGSFASVTLPITEENKSNIMYIASNKLWNCEDLVGVGLQVVENRAYIDMAQVPTYAEYQEAQQNSNSAPRRRVTLGKDAEQIATGFENINAGDKPMKLMINGQIFILRGEKMYDATGRLVK